MPSRAEASRIGRGASSARVSWSSADARGGLGLVDRGLRPARAPAASRSHSATAASWRTVARLTCSVCAASAASCSRSVVSAAFVRWRAASSARARVGERLAQRVGDDRDLVAALGRGIPLRREFETRAALPGSRAHGVLGDDLAGAGDDRDRAADRGRARAGRAAQGGVEVVGDDDVREDAEHARRAPSRRRAPARCRRARGSSGRVARPPRRSRCRRRRGRRRAPTRAVANASSRVSTSSPSASGPSAAAIAAS